MNTKKLLVKTGALFAIIAIAVALFLLWFAPPLRPSSDYSVTYTVSGQSYSDGRVFRPFGMASRYYISTPSPSPSQNTRNYRWFVVDFSRGVVAKTFPYIGTTWPYNSPYIHSDQSLGILLTDMKMEDNWQVSVTATTAQFSNGSMSVRVTKNH